MKNRQTLLLLVTACRWSASLAYKGLLYMFVMMIVVSMLLIVFYFLEMDFIT